MNVFADEKYYLDHSSFSIQRLRRTGYNTMPRPHTHTFYELYYLLQGERIYFMNGKVYTAQKGDLVLVRPGDLHSTSSSQVKVVERVLVHFSPDFLREADRSLLELPAFGESALLHFPIKEQSELERLLLSMLAECKEQPPLYKSFVRQLLVELLIRIHRSAPSASNRGQFRHPMHEKVSEIASFIHTHYKETLTLEQLSRLYYISPAYLSRVFLKLTGFHLSEYIRVVRVREAQSLLRLTNSKVQMIAEQVGFEHVTHFNKTFKTIAGCEIKPGDGGEQPPTSPAKSRSASAKSR
ncbi:MAG: AraC family transcriptional regulator [Paenibacillaceae bacterium]|nr:AraC family transcriptional regulator [Paenibacillaceae bacterium]